MIGYIVETISILAHILSELPGTPTGCGATQGAAGRDWVSVTRELNLRHSLPANGTTLYILGDAYSRTAHTDPTKIYSQIHELYGLCAFCRTDPHFLYHRTTFVLVLVVLFVCYCVS